MSVEGMWAMFFGDVYGSSHANSGVVVFETNRMFGGDSFIAYVGSYQVQHGSKVTASARTWTYNNTIGPVRTVFGREGPIDVTVHFEGVVGDDDQTIRGEIWEEGSSQRLPAALRKISQLP